MRLFAPDLARTSLQKYGTTVTSSYPIFTFTSTVVRTIYTSSTTTTAKGAVQTVDTYNQVHNGYGPASRVICSAGI